MGSNPRPFATETVASVLASSTIRTSSTTHRSISVRVRSSVAAALYAGNPTMIFLSFNIRNAFGTFPRPHKPIVGPRAVDAGCYARPWPTASPAVRSSARDPVVVGEPDQGDGGANDRQDDPAATDGGHERQRQERGDREPVAATDRRVAAVGPRQGDYEDDPPDIESDDRCETDPMGTDSSSDEERCDAAGEEHVLQRSGGDLLQVQRQCRSPQASGRAGAEQRKRPAERIQHQQRLTCDLRNRDRVRPKHVERRQ